MPKLPSEIWRYFVTDGVPGSGSHKPVKSDITEWANDIQYREFDIAADAQAAAESGLISDGKQIKVIGLNTVDDEKGFDAVVVASGGLKEHPRIKKKSEISRLFASSYRDLKSYFMSVKPSNLNPIVVVEKIRTATYTEFAVFFQIGGVKWMRLFFTQRFNLGNQGFPRMTWGSVANLFSTGAGVHSENQTTGTLALPETEIILPAAATDDGSWTSGTYGDNAVPCSFTSTVGKTRTYSIACTAGDRVVLRGVTLTNGGFGSVIVRDGGTEIPAANYLIDAAKTVNYRNQATSGDEIYVPIFKAPSTGTFDLEITCAEVSGVSGRIYDAGVHRWAGGIPDTAIGRHGIAAERPDGSKRSYFPGDKFVYTIPSTTSVTWNYRRDTKGGIAKFKVVGSAGAEIGAYANNQVDTYGSAADLSINVASSLPVDNYFLVVETDQTTSAPTGDFYIQDRGVEGASVAEGDPLSDSFDLQSMPSSPSSFTQIGTHVLLGLGNFEQSIEVTEVGVAARSGGLDFAGGSHAYESNPTNEEFSFEDTPFDYAAGTANQKYFGSTFRYKCQTTLRVPATDTDFATVEHELIVSRLGFSVITKTTIDRDVDIHDDFALEQISPRKDSGTTISADVGGGFEKVELSRSGSFVVNNASDGYDLKEQNDAVIYHNDEYAILGRVTNYDELNAGVGEKYGFDGNYTSVEKQPDDNKTYLRSFIADGGVTLPAGTTWTTKKFYSVSEANGIAALLV